MNLLKHTSEGLIPLALLGLGSCSEQEKDTLPKRGLMKQFLATTHMILATQKAW